MDIRYSYEVRPRRPIKIAGGVRPIVRACVVQLTKEEVKEYMKKGANVYRKFPDGTTMKITGENLNACHASKYSPNIPVVEHKSVPNPFGSVKQERGRVATPPKEENHATEIKSEDKTEAKQEPTTIEEQKVVETEVKSEEKVEETSKEVSNTNDSGIDTTEKVADNTSEVTEDAKADDVAEVMPEPVNAEVVDNKKQNNYDKQQNYKNGKNKKNN